MPLVRVSLPQSITDPQMKQILDQVHECLVEHFAVPADDRFQIASRHPGNELIWPPEYLGIAHRGPVILIQITCNEGRTLVMKQALYADLARRIEAIGVVSAADVIINLVEVKKENWSFGNGRAPYA